MAFHRTPRVACAAICALLLLSVAASSQSSTLDLTLGVVRYSDSVADIWTGMSDYFESEHDIALRVALHDSYEALVADLVAGVVDIAWNGPIAHVNATVLAEKDGGRLVSLGMRDVDRDMRSVVVARRGWLAAKNLLPESVSEDASLSLSLSKASEEMRSAIEEAGRSGRIAAGARDSPQGFVVPYFHLVSKLGLKLSRADVTTFDVDIGKHGDTARGEVRALESLSRGESDLAMVSHAMLERYLADRDSEKAASGGEKAASSGEKAGGEEAGGVKAGGEKAGGTKAGDDNEFLVFEDEILLDHCRFDALQSKVPVEALERFTAALLRMDMGNERHAPIMKAEGIARVWQEARLLRDDEMLQAMILAGLDVPDINNQRDEL